MARVDDLSHKTQNLVRKWQSNVFYFVKATLETNTYFVFVESRSSYLDWVACSFSVQRNDFSLSKWQFLFYCFISIVPGCSLPRGYLVVVEEATEVAKVVAFPKNLVFLVVAVVAAMAALVLPVLPGVALRLLMTPVSNLLVGFQFNNYSRRSRPHIQHKLTLALSKQSHCKQIVW